MKTIKCLLSAIAFVPALVLAEDNVSTNADYVAGERSTVLVTPELRALAGQLFGANAEQLLHAVELNMNKYDLDMAHPDGRKSWHGRMHHEEVSTNGLFKVEVYSNELTGATWRYRLPWKKVDAATQVKAANAKLPRPVTTNGIPAKLAAARLRRQVESQTVSNVTVTVEANR